LAFTERLFTTFADDDKAGLHIEFMTKTPIGFEQGSHAVDLEGQVQRAARHEPIGHRLPNAQTAVRPLGHLRNLDAQAAGDAQGTADLVKGPQGVVEPAGLGGGLGRIEPTRDIDDGRRGVGDDDDGNQDSEEYAQDQRG
jgi:hypothetical protein